MTIMIASDNYNEDFCDNDNSSDSYNDNNMITIAITITIIIAIAMTIISEIYNDSDSYDW